MAVLQVILMSSIFITLVTSSPIERSLDQHLNLKSKEILEKQVLQKHHPMLVKDGDFDNELIVVEFLYNFPDGEAVQKGTDRERYDINQVSNAVNGNSKENTTAILEVSAKSTGSNILNIEKTTDLKVRETFNKNFIKNQWWILGPKEESSIIEQNQFHYGTINPISPFPEKESRSKDIESFSLEDNRTKLVEIFTVAQQSKKTIESAGPLPFPKSVYTRDLDLPFFD